MVLDSSSPRGGSGCAPSRVVPSFLAAAASPEQQVTRVSPPLPHPGTSTTTSCPTCSRPPPPRSAPLPRIRLPPAQASRPPVSFNEQACEESGNSPAVPRSSPPRLPVMPPRDEPDVAITPTSPALPAADVVGAGDGGPLNTSQENTMDDQPGVQVIKNERFEKPVFSSSRGLFDLLADVNKPMAVYTRQCSVSLPLGLGIHPYGSKPTADSSPPDINSLTSQFLLQGQFLLEIFEVSSNFPFVGTILVCDEHSSKTIYYKDNWNQTYKDFFSRRAKWVSSGNAAVEFKDKMVIEPSRAITADCGFVIKVHTPETKRKASEICKLSRNTDKISLYNKLKTYTIKTNRGRLYVTCSVLPDALQGFIEVLLQLPSHQLPRGVADATIYGVITAHIEKFDIGSTLFSKDFNEGVALEASPHDALCSKESYSSMEVPLMRSILAVPLGEYLHIKGKLQVRGYDAVPITIDHRILIDRWSVHTPWIKCGESLSAVRIWLSPIF